MQVLDFFFFDDFSPSSDSVKCLIRQKQRTLPFIHAVAAFKENILRVHRE